MLRQMIHTHTPRKYEKIYNLHNGGLWNKQSSHQQAREGWREPGKWAGLRPLLWGQGWVGTGVNIYIMKRWHETSQMGYSEN